jgi:hypothetical protein
MGPAKRTGLKAGDVIVTMNECSTNCMARKSVFHGRECARAYLANLALLSWGWQSEAQSLMMGFDWNQEQGM